jgi:hypothetical protein
LNNVILLIQAYQSSRLANSEITQASVFDLRNGANLNLVLCSLDVRPLLEGAPFLVVNGSTLNLTDVNVQSFRAVNIHVISIANGMRIFFFMYFFLRDWG